MNPVEVAHKDSPEVAPISLSRLARTLNAYRGAIVLSLAAILFFYVIIVGYIVLTAPSRRVTSQSFQLEFEGAETGLYPNGTQFSPAEIVSLPILDRVYKANDLREFLPFTVFAQSVYVVEANQALEDLTREYQARLSDPKLSSLDRERIVREFESKKKSISKNQYSVNFSTPKREHDLPVALAKKVLRDVLAEWAHYATREQRILQYQVAVLSPNTFDHLPNKSLNYIARLQVLRSNFYRVIANTEAIEALPGGKLAQTRTGGLTLNDIRIKLDDIVRFRLEPLFPAIRSSGLITDVPAAIRFCETQLGHDERALAVVRSRAEVVRQALNAYANRVDTDPELSAPAGDAPTARPETRARMTEGIAPVLSEGFLERLVNLTSAAGDMAYRQRLVDDYRAAATQAVPLEAAVAYDRELIEQLRAAPATQSGVTAESVEQQIAEMQAQLKDAVKNVNELYSTISRNLEPETHLFTTTGVPTARSDRAVDPKRLVGFGILIFLLSLPLVIVGALIHNRMRQEDEIEHQLQ